MRRALTLCPCGEIGRRAALKMRFRKECWFESGQGHHNRSRVTRHETGFDQLEEFADGCFGTGAFGASLLEIACTTLIGFENALFPLFDQCLGFRCWKRTVFNRP